MVEYNTEIQETLNNGKFVENIQNTFKDRLNEVIEIGLWGAEPTINSEYFRKFLFDLLPLLPNIKNIMFSTNALLGWSALKKFFDAIDEYSKLNNKELKLKIQFSLDGPEYINDSSRHKGATKSTLQAIDDCIHNFVNYYSKSNLMRLCLNTKCTLDIIWMQYFNNHLDKLYEFYKFYDDLQLKYCQYINEKLELYLADRPTVINPGTYSKDDGIIFYNWIKNIAKIDDSNFQFVKHPLYTNSFWDFSNGYYYKDILFQAIENEYGICSAGTYSISVDYKGDISSCHRIVDSFYDITGKQEELAKNIGTFSLIKEKDKQLKYAQLDYVEEIAHIDITARYTFFKEQILALIYSNYLDKTWFDEERIKNLFICICNINCYLNSFEITGSRFITPLQYINLFAFGASDALKEYYTSITEGKKR